MESTYTQGEVEEILQNLQTLVHSDVSWLKIYTYFNKLKLRKQKEGTDIGNLV